MYSNLNKNEIFYEKRRRDRATENLSGSYEQERHNKKKENFPARLHKMYN